MFYEENTSNTPSKTAQKVTLMGSGAILTEVIQAADQLEAQGVEVTIISVTSWSELARDGQACEIDQQPTWLAQTLQGSEGAIIAASDYVRAVPEQIRAYIPSGRSYKTLGTDGFGRSDTRAALRDFFQVDASSIVRAAEAALQSQSSTTFTRENH